MRNMLDQISQAQRERLFHIDFRAWFLGSVTRQDLMSRFNIKPAAATQDMTRYRDLAPDNLDFDGSAKVYRQSASFKPLFAHDPQTVLTALCQGIGDDLAGTVVPHLRAEHPLRLNAPDLTITATLSRAIAEETALKVKYHSLTTGTSTREIVPHALVDTGIRWHVRAWDRRRSRFGDFVLTRIETASPLDPAPEAETREHDDQWMRFVSLELVAHPGHAHPTTIQRDYAMTDGILTARLRAALCGYALLHWNVDATEDHTLDPNRHHLWLRNTPALYGVENLKLARGCT